MKTQHCRASNEKLASVEKSSSVEERATVEWRSSAKHWRVIVDNERLAMTSCCRRQVHGLQVVRVDSSTLSGYRRRAFVDDAINHADAEEDSDDADDDQRH